jgi:hypothetical protein
VGEDQSPCSDSRNRDCRPSGRFPQGPLAEALHGIKAVRKSQITGALAEQKTAENRIRRIDADNLRHEQAFRGLAEAD